MNSHQIQIYEHIIGMISDDRLGPGTKLPTEVELGNMFKTNRLNAHYAMKSLESAGIVARNKKGGSTIKVKPSKYTLGQLRSVTANRVCVLNQYHAEISNIHWNERLIVPLEKRLRDNDLELDYRNIHEISDPAVYKQILTEQISAGCKAIVLIAPGDGKGIAFERPEMLSEFHDNVFIFDPGQSVWQGFPYNTVSLNLFGEGVMAAERLIVHHGLKRIAVLRMSGPQKTWFEQRLKGIACSMKRLLGEGHEPELVDVDTPTGDMLKSFANAASLGIIAANDEMGAGLVDVARETSVAIGGDGLKLVSFDDNTLYLDRSLTTVAPALDRIGERLAEMIVNGIKGNGQDEVACIKINSKLIVRHSS